MTRTRRISVLLSLVIALSLTVSAAEAGAAARATDEHGALQILHRAQSLLQGAGVRTGHELSPILARLVASLPALKGRDLVAAKHLLARPTDGFTDPGDHGFTVPEAPPLCNPRFCIHYVTSTPDAPDLTDANGDGAPDAVQNVDALMNTVYDTEVTRMGWRVPLSDQHAENNGGDGRIDVYLADIGGDGIYGYAAPDPQTVFGNTIYGYLVLDNDFSPSQFPYADPFQPRAVTTAHEFNHLIQFSYDALQDLWLMEATATWFEEAVFPAIDDYLQYVGPWAASPGVSITTPSAQKVYGDVLWNIWLAGRFGAPVIERAWANSLTTHPPDFAPEAYETAIRQLGSGEVGMSEEFGAFTAAVAEWQAPGSGFPEGARYPDVARAGDLPIGGGTTHTTLDHGSFALYNVPLTGRKVITLETEFPDGTASSAALVARMPGGAVKVQRESSIIGRNTKVSLAGVAGAERITAVIANADFTTSGYSSVLGDWSFDKDGQDVTAKVIGRAQYPSAFVGSQARQRRATVIKRGLQIKIESFEETRTIGASIQLTMSSSALRSAKVVGRLRVKVPASAHARKYRVKLSRTARRALAHRKSTSVGVHVTFTEPTGTATAHDSETIIVR